MNADDLREDRNKKFQTREHGSYERYRQRNRMSDQILNNELNGIAEEREQVKNYDDEVVWVGDGYGDRRFHADTSCGALTRRDRATKAEAYFLEEVVGRAVPCKRCYPTRTKVLPHSA